MRFKPAWNILMLFKRGKMKKNLFEKKKTKKIQTIDGEGAYTGVNPTPYTDYEKKQKEKKIKKK